MAELAEIDDRGGTLAALSRRLPAGRDRRRRLRRPAGHRGGGADHRRRQRLRRGGRGAATRAPAHRPGRSRRRQVERTHAVRAARDPVAAAATRGSPDGRGLGDGERPAPHPRLRRGRRHARRDRERAAERLGRASAVTHRTDPPRRDRRPLDRRGPAALSRASSAGEPEAPPSTSRRSASASASCRPAPSRRPGSSWSSPWTTRAASRASSPPRARACITSASLTDDLPALARRPRGRRGRAHRPRAAPRRPRHGRIRPSADAERRALGAPRALGLEVRLGQLSMCSPSAPKTHQTPPTPWPLTSPAAASAAK